MSIEDPVLRGGRHAMRPIRLRQLTDDGSGRSG